MILSKNLICLLFIGMASCVNTARQEALSNIQISNSFIDAFYSFSQDSLESMLPETEGTARREILYYQKWAECGHYVVLQRDGYYEKNDSTIIFPVTVKDDLMESLLIDFNVTDTFRITFRNGKIHTIQTSSNDPDEYYEAKEWVRANHPELVAEVCGSQWAEGQTPCECIKAMVQGFRMLKEGDKS